jgi:hypothetical protein
MARKIGLITKDTPEDIAKREGVLVDEMSPELAAQAKAIVLDGAQMALMMEEGLSHIMRTHDEVVIAGCVLPLTITPGHSRQSTHRNKHALCTPLTSHHFPERTRARSSR